MEHPHEPVEAIKEWQRWYKDHQVVGLVDEPQEAKESRENLHETSNAVSTMPDWREFFKEVAGDSEGFSGFKQKAVDCFADTIAEFSDEMTGNELFECFLIAATDHLRAAEKQYKNAKQMVNLVLYKNAEA